MAAKNGLTPKQEQFCREYLIDHNATQAAIRSGCSPRSADVTAARWLGKASVQDRIRTLTEAQSKRLELKADDILRELLLIAQSDVEDYTIDDSGRLVTADRKKTRAVSSVKRKIRRIVGTDGSKKVEEIETEIKLWPKVEALKLLGQHLRLWIERHEHGGDGGGPIQHTHEYQHLRGLPAGELLRIYRQEIAAPPTLEPEPPPADPGTGDVSQ